MNTQAINKNGDSTLYKVTLLNKDRKPILETITLLDEIVETDGILIEPTVTLEEIRVAQKVLKNLNKKAIYYIDNL